MSFLTRTRVIATASILLLGGGGAYAWRALHAPRAADATDRLATVARKDLVLKITAPGALRAVQSNKFRVDVDRPVRIESVLPQGTLVKQGDCVLTLDKTETQQLIESLDLQRQNAEKALAVAEETLRLQQITNANNIQDARDALEQARKGLDEYVELEGPKLSKDVSIRLDDAKVKLEDARKQRADLVDQQEAALFVAEDQEEQNRKALEAANRAIHTAQTAMEVVLLDQKIFKLYGYPTELLRRKQALAKAKISLEQARISAEAGLLDKDAQVAARRNDLKQIVTNLDRAKEDLGKLAFDAPVGGYVIWGDPDGFWGGHVDLKTPGALFNKGQILITIPDTSAYVVGLQIPEDYRSRLKKGLEAVATFEAAPGVVLHGAITDISNLATGGWDPEAARSYSVTVSLEGGNPALTPGMSTRVEIIVGRLSGALVVPVDAVHREEGKTFCYIQGTPPQKREVKVGPGSDDEVSIESGLSEGEKVVLGRLPQERRP